ncbi:MAG: hypothetical protein WC307_06015 [Candidatus Nanoarchaeia archaeon]|jgi:hypothetical protein
MNPIIDFELMTKRAKLKALSNTSLTRELTDEEFNEMKQLFNEVNN